ncbi:MAG: hypothetical protein WCU00_13355, partial [Candidatus Latescibacterota bacterium]
MKRMLVFLLFIIALAVGSNAFAQDFESPRLSYGFGMGGAQGDNTGSDKWVQHYRAFVQYRLVPEYMMGQVSLGYAKLRADEYKADIIMLDNRFL